MAIIKNKLCQRITIDLKSGKSVGLLSKGTANVSDNDLTSPYLKRYIERGEVVVLSSGTLKKEGTAKKKEDTVKKKGNK
ncbi:MAG: hypothetical protein ACC630_01730 [Nitrospinota bacterium]